ncbi:hypothetical protein ACWCPM_18680 [Streptomyces sp. NPDC002309]
MDERESLLNSDPDEHRSPLGWKALAVVMSAVVWMAFGPLGPLWVYVLGWALALAAAEAVFRLARRRGRAWVGRPPTPGRLAAALLGLGPQSRLLDPRWARTRLAAGGFLLFATIAGAMGWNAAQDYRMLAALRDHGHRTDATVVEIVSRSDGGMATTVNARFGTPSGPVRADVEVASGSAIDAEPGAQIPVVYNPAAPAEVIHVEYLDGRQVDGIRQGSIVIGLLGVGFLVGAAWEAVRARRQKDGGRAPDVRLPKT